MFGIEDIIILMAYVLSILSAVFCVVYGILNWNKGQELEKNEIDEELKWQEKENQINENL